MAKTNHLLKKQEVAKQSFFQKIRTAFFAHKKLAVILLIILLVGGFFLWQRQAASSQTPQYQTAKVEKGTIVSSVSTSGTVLTSNLINVQSGSSGVVKEVYVQDGETVTTGQKIAEVQLDLSGQQKNTQAWASYLSAKTALDAANANLYSLQADMFSKSETFYNLATNSTYQNADGTPNYTNRALPEFHIAEKEWLASEAKFKNQQAVITQAQVAVDSNYLSYEQTSSTITAPSAGTLTNLTIAPGITIGSSQGSSSTSTTSTSTSNQSSSNETIAVIKGEGNPIVSVNVSEIDVARLKVGQQATVTLDSIADKTFTGRVLTVDKIGEVSSGVTNYPVTIQLDNNLPEILPNMAASAKVIVATKEDALLVPSQAIQTQNGSKIVRILKNKKLNNVVVETGLTSDSQTEIVSGLSAGETIVTSQNQAEQTSSQSGSGSLFGGFGGGQMRIAR